MKFDKQFRIGFTRAQLTLLVVGTMLLAVFGATWGAQQLTHSVTENELARELADALVENCEASIVYRRVARRRALANDVVMRTQIGANEALIKVVNEVNARTPGAFPAIVRLGAVLDRTNAALNRARANSPAPLPLPDCETYRELLSG